jgi:succinylglutamic semialdehyde dehydrogenase
MIFEEISPLGNYLAGRFVPPEPSGNKIISYNPGNLRDIVGRFPVSPTQVDEAVQAARKAFPSWSSSTLGLRKKYLSRFKKVLQRNSAELAQLIAREVGKPLWEAQNEVSLMLNKIDITIQESLRRIRPFHIPDIKGHCYYHPKGVLVVIGPFNFPGHLPNGHIIPALLTGNTVVFKPSEYTPATGQFIAMLMDRARFPAGVFNLVQGGREIGAALCRHSMVDGVLFTGSYETGLAIKRATVEDYWKIVVLEMGGKNAVIVTQDADLEGALYETLIGALLTTGQRCTSTSRVILLGGIAEPFIKQLVQLIPRFQIGYAFDQEVFMGPLISNAAQERFIYYQELAIQEGTELILEGRVIKREYPGYYVSPAIHLVKSPNPNSKYQNEEIFAPDLALYVVSDLTEAIEIVNQCPYGLAVSIFSRDERHYQEALQSCRAGIINWNRATTGASSRLPFGGIGKSGNHFPTALFAPYYCTYPVASLEGESSFDHHKLLPGIDWPVKLSSP